VFLLFKRNLLAYSLLLLPYCLLVRVKSVMPNFEPVVLTNQCSAHWEQMISAVLPNTLVQSLVAIFLIFIQAVMLNRIAIKHRLTQKMTLFPGMIYIILCSILVENLSLTQFTIGNFFAILALSHSVDIYKKFKPELILFKGGFWLGFAIICSPIYFLLYIPVVGVLISLRTFSIKELFQILVGTFTSLLILLSLQFCFGNVGFIETYLSPTFHIMPLNLNPFITGYLALIGLLILMSIVSYSKFTLKKSLPSKKKIDTLYLILMSSIALVLLNCNESFNILYYLWIPLSILTSMFFIQSKHLILPEIIHLILLVVIINNHFNLLSLI